MRRLLAVGAGLLALAGCTSGPNYHIPETAMIKAAAANGPFVAGNEPVYAQAPLPDHWWRLYDDPRLDGYVMEALAANTDLRAADANLRRASFVVREAQAARTVQTSVSAEALASQVGFFTEPLPGFPYAYSLGLNLSYPLDLAGGIKRGIEAARADSEAVQAARDQVRVAVAAAVTRSYAAACSANRTLAAERHIVDIERQTLDVVGRLRQGGRGTSFDVTRARAAADQSAAAIPTIIAARQASLFELAALMGRAPENYPRELENCAAPPALKRLLPIGDGAALLRRRPDVRAAERQLAAATADIGVATSDLYPHVALGGTLGVAGPFQSLTSSETVGGSIGPLVSWNFPNRIAVRARIGEAGAAADVAAARFDGSVIDALRQTETALTAYAREIDRDTALEHSRADAERATDQANRLFHYGRTGFLDVLTTQASLANAQAALASSQSDVIDRQVDVFLALGGGWEP